MEGGCLCGSLRYRLTGKPFAADYCHCSICRKQSGSVVVAWMDFKSEQVEWLSAKPSYYQSSAHVERGFCSQCGSTLTFGDSRYKEFTTLTIASLDDANLVKPTYHIHTKDQVSWLTIKDNCKRYLQSVSD